MRKDRILSYSWAIMTAAKSAYPKSVFFIVGNEFCERFCYYGMRGRCSISYTKIYNAIREIYVENLIVCAIWSRWFHFVPIQAAHMWLSFPAILVLYLTDWLNFSDDTSTAIYHAFTFMCYFTPLFGAVLADGYIGRYKFVPAYIHNANCTSI